MKWVRLASFFIFGILHGSTLLPLLAGMSLLLVFVLHIDAAGIARGLRRTHVLLAFALIAYLMLNQALHGYVSHLWTFGFIREDGKVFYMLAIFIALALIPADKLIPGVIAAAIGFSIGVFGIQILVHLVGLGSAIAAELAIETVGGHQVLAGYAAQVLLLLFVAFRLETKSRHRMLLGALVAISFAAFLMNFSRSFALGALAGCGVAYVMSKRSVKTEEAYFFRTIMPAAFLAAVLVIGVLLSYGQRFEDLDEDRNVLSRFQLWERAIGYIDQGLLFGTGLGGFSRAGAQVEPVGVPYLMNTVKGGTPDWEMPEGVKVGDGGLHTHNLYLQILTESGLIGFMFWAVFFGVLVARATAILRHGQGHYVRGEVRFAAVFVISMIVLGLVAGLTAGLSLLGPSQSFLLYLVGPVVCAPFRDQRKVADQGIPIVPKKLAL